MSEYGYGGDFECQVSVPCAGRQIRVLIGWVDLLDKRSSRDDSVRGGYEMCPRLHHQAIDIVCFGADLKDGPQRILIQARSVRKPDASKLSVKQLSRACWTKA